MTDEKGNQSGILVDLKDELSRRLGVNIVLEEFRTIPALLAASENKKIDVVNCIIPQRADKRGLLRTEVFLRSYVAVYTRDGISIKTPDDMAGKTIAIPRDAGYAKQFVQPYIEAVNIIYADTPEDGLRMVHSREADGFVGTTTHNYLINKYRFFGVSQAYVNLDKSTPFAMGIRADWPELAAILNKGLASFGKNGVEDIVARWIQIAGQEKGIDLSSEEQAWLAQIHTVRVRVVDFPPFIIAKEGKEPRGIAIDYLHLIAERTGIRFLYDFSTLPFAEALERLKNRKSPDLIISMMRTPERERFISFSNKYLRTPRVIFARTEAGFISGIGDLIGKVIAVPRGTVVQREIEKKYPGFGLKLFDADSEALEAVAMGKADAYIGNLTLGSYIILNKGLTNLKVAAPTDLQDHFFSFGSRKDWPI
jgi:ABC-type amino acid transport substrate-binding protein